MTQRTPQTKSEHKCTGKVKYASERIASLRADQLTAQRGVKLYPYRCPVCNRWHHTQQRPAKGYRRLEIVDRTPAIAALDDFEVLA